MSDARGMKTTGQAGVVEVIRQAILSNDLAPGQRLIEADLCEMLGTSRGTLRAALTDLIHEGLVERIANRGARVRIVHLEEALQVADVRLAIELLCVEEAIARLTEADAAELRLLAARLEARAAANDVEGFAEITNAIFKYYVHLSGNQVAMETLEKLRDRMSRHRLRLTYRPGRQQVALPFWLTIVEAICNRDTAAAQAVMRAHVANVKETMRTLSQEGIPLGRLPR